MLNFVFQLLVMCAIKKCDEILSKDLPLEFPTHNPAEFRGFPIAVIQLRLKNVAACFDAGDFNIDETFLFPDIILFKVYPVSNCKQIFNPRIWAWSNQEFLSRVQDIFLYWCNSSKEFFCP